MGPRAGVSSATPSGFERRLPLEAARIPPEDGSSRRRLDRRGTVHVALNARHASVANVDEDGDLGLDLDAAPLATPVLPLQDHDAVAGIDEVLRLEPALVPRLQILRVEMPVLIEPACDPSFLE